MSGIYAEGSRNGIRGGFAKWNSRRVRETGFAEGSQNWIRERFAKLCIQKRSIICFEEIKDELSIIYSEKTGSRI